MPMLRFLVSLICVVWTFSAPASAQDGPIMLDPAAAPFAVVEVAGVLLEEEDRDTGWDTRLTIADLMAMPLSAFSPVLTRQIGFGQTWSVVHVRIPVTNPEPDPQTWLLAFNHPGWLMEAEAYLVPDGAGPPAAPVFSFPRDQSWSEADRIMHTTFEMPPATTATLYVSYRNFASAAPMTIETVTGFAERRRLNDLIIFIALGALVGIAVVALSLIGLLYRQIALYYAGYLVSISTILCFNIIPINGIWFMSDRMFAAFADWLIVAAVFSLMMFHWTYFAKSPAISPVWRAMLLASAFGFVAVNIAFQLSLVPALALQLTLVLCGIFGLVNGILAVQTRQTGGWFFAAGCFVLAICTAPEVLKTPFSGYVTFDETLRVFVFGIVFEAVALSGAMFAKVHEIRKEREAALSAELQLTREKLETAQRLAAAAHDFQQPLSSLRMALTDPKAPDGQSQGVSQAIDYLEELVKSQMVTPHGNHPDHAPEADPADEVFEIGIILANLRPMFENEARGKGLSLRIVPSRQQVRTNAFALMRVVSNLVSNAIGNTAIGGVLVGVRRRGDHLRIDICDTGPGMEPDHLVRLTEPYDPPEGGRGLGLGIVRRLCAENGLRIEARSVPGRGTVLHVFVPRAEMAAARAIRRGVATR